MTAVVLALLVGLYFLISGLQHKSATIHCQKIAQTPPPKQDFVGRGRSFYSFIYGNTAQFPPSGLSTAPAAAAPCLPYRHLELCGIALSLAQSVLEIFVAEGHDAAGGAAGGAGKDSGQRHAVEGIIFAGGIDCHIAEHQQISHVGNGIHAVIPDDIPGGSAAANSGGR